MVFRICCYLYIVTGRILRCLFGGCGLLLLFRGFLLLFRDHQIQICCFPDLRCFLTFILSCQYVKGQNAHNHYQHNK